MQLYAWPQVPRNSIDCPAQSSTLEFGRMHTCWIKVVVLTDVVGVSNPEVCFLGLLKEVQVSDCPFTFAETPDSLKTQPDCGDACIPLPFLSTFHKPVQHSWLSCIGS